MGQAGSRRTEITRSLRENAPSVAAVDLDGVRLAERDVRKLSEALRQNRCAIDSESGWVSSCSVSPSVVQKLSLEGCELTPGAVQHVAGVLCNSVHTCSIRRLSLANNDAVSHLSCRAHHSHCVP